MTTIVYRDGVMAGDSRAWSGDKHPIGSKLKIRRMDDGTLIGCSTTVPGGGEKVLDWYEGGRKADSDLPETFTFLAAHRNGEVYYACDSTMLSGPLEDEFFSVGSGEQYAMGALHMGASAEEAVRVACMLDAWTGFPVYTVSHRRKSIYRIDQ